MIKEIKKEGNRLIVFSNKGIKTVNFSSEVDDTIIHKDSVLVRVYNNAEYNDRNIFRLSEEGKIIWQVEQPDPFKVPERTACFTYLGVDNDVIKAHSLNGCTYEIDFETGKLSNRVFTK